MEILLVLYVLSMVKKNVENFETPCIGEIQANTWVSIMEHLFWPYRSIKMSSVENK